MKLKFKVQAFQTDAVNAVVDCFAGQPKSEGVSYRIDPGKGEVRVKPSARQQKLFGQAATMVVAHLTYNPVDDRHKLNEIFTVDKKADFSRAVKTKRHVYDYVFTDSDNERKFVTTLDTSTEVVVYAKLSKGFFIPTPVGSYNSDWAIVFKEGAVKHIYFVAETKGSMSSLELRAIEISKIDCARKFFAGITSDQVKYDVVDSYDKLMDLVGCLPAMSN